MLSIVIIHKYVAIQLALKKQLIHHWYFQFGPLVLKSDSHKFFNIITDRNQTVSRRFKPSSRTTLIDEQSNP